MKLEDRFFPRIWDGKRYWYPCFSEFGITYEANDLPLAEENMRTLDWALGWHFHRDTSSTYLEFDHIVEQCTGLKDKNGKLIYEGDIVEYSDDYWVVIYNKPRMEWGLMGYDYAIYGRDIKKYDLDVISCEIIGNIHENPELLEQSNDD